MARGIICKNWHKSLRASTFSNPEIPPSPPKICRRNDQTVTNNLKVDKSFGECPPPLIPAKKDPCCPQSKKMHCLAKASELANPPPPPPPSQGYGGIWVPSENGPPGRTHHVNFLHLSSSLKGLFTGKLPSEVFHAHLETSHNRPLKQPEVFQEVCLTGLRFKEQKPTFIFLSRLL